MSLICRIAFLLSSIFSELVVPFLSRASSPRSTYVLQNKTATS